MEKELLEDWDFKGEDTKEYTHGFHTYPAMMIPQIVRKILEMYGKNAKVLLDPFCGSGTSLVESSLSKNIQKAYGFDLNPLAILIAKVKITPIETSKLRSALDFIFNNTGVVKVPLVSNLNFWFKQDVIEKLNILKAGVEKIDNKDIQDFFKVVLSETIRNVSNTRKGEFKLYRKNKERLENFNPNVIKEFEKIALKNIRGMEDYFNANPQQNITLKLFNSMDELPINNENIDIIITSPPYGDSITTVAYGQFSRLALQWLNHRDINNLDKELLGGKPTKDLDIHIDSPTLKKIIEKISKKDEKRAREVLSFYTDFDKVVIQLNNVLNKNGFVCFVVGNRTVKGINIPTDKIMVEMFHAHGNYKDVALHQRTIPNKRMPKVTSPTNIKGELSPTMSKEFIFVLQKI